MQAHPLAFISIPFSQSAALSRRAALALMLRAPALVLFYREAAAQQDSPGSVLYLRTDRPYTLHSLNPKARTKTRRALECCVVRRMGLEELAIEGEELNRQTMFRQGRGEDEERAAEEWRITCRAASGLADFEAWGAYVNGRLAACSVCALVEGCYDILLQASATDLLHRRPNNALAFTITQTALARPDVRAVSYGVRVRGESPGLGVFKEGMGFRPVLRHDRVVVNPVLRGALACGGARLIAGLRAQRPESGLWGTAGRFLDLARGVPY